jgi:hypothetical protein
MINEKRVCTGSVRLHCIPHNEGWRPRVVIAALKPGDRSRFPWAMWYSELMPKGEFRKVPAAYVSLSIDDRIAQSMITIIQSGGSLPREVVTGLPVISVTAHLC